MSSTDSYTDDNTVACDGHVEGSCSQDTTWNTLYSGTAGGTGTDSARIFAPPLCPYGYSTDLVRLDLDTEAASGWNGFDAIAAYGTTGLPTGLINPSTAASPNRVMYTPTAGIHGPDYVAFKVTDCSDLSGTSAGITVTVEPPTGSFFEPFVYVVTADGTYLSKGEVSAATLDLSAVHAELGDVTAIVEVWASDFNSVSLSSANSAISAGDAIRLNLTSSSASLDLDVVSSDASRDVIIGSEFATMSRLELWVYDSTDASDSPTTYRIMLENCPFGFTALLLSGSSERSCVSCATIADGIDAGTLVLSSADSDNYQQICSSAAHAAYQCAPGYFFDLSDYTCISCTSGTFAAGVGVRDSCVPCPKAYYAPEAAMGLCLACEFGSFTDFAGATACQSCPAGATCDAVSLTVNPGMWLRDPDSLDIHECPLGRVACPGGNASDDSCNTGYAGVLCAVCQPGYILSAQGCADCSSLQVPIATIIVTIMGISIALIISYLVLTNKRIAAMMEAISISAPFKIYFSTIQILGTYSILLSDVLFDPLQGFFASMSFITDFADLFSGFGLSCANDEMRSFKAKLLISTLVPVMAGVAVAVVFFVWIRLAHPDRLQALKRARSTAALMVLYVTLPSTATMIFRTFVRDGRALGTRGEHYLIADYNGKPQYTAWICPSAVLRVANPPTCCRRVAQSALRASNTNNSWSRMPSFASSFTPWGSMHSMR